MLYVFSGGDIIETRKRAHECIAQREAEGATVRTVLGETYEHGVVSSVSQSASLFGGTECVVFDTFGDNTDAFSELVEHIEILKDSPHAVVVIEGKLSADDAKVFKQHAKEFVETKAGVKEFFNAFSMADALAKKDKKMLWVLFTRAQNAGLSPEEIVGTLFWQLKAIRLSKVTKSAGEADIKDFPYNKAKSAGKNFTAEELERLSEELITLYHEGHLGSDMSLSLERWVLRV